MHEYFYTLADAITALLQGDEIYTCTFRGEDSDFVRFNRSAVRQAGTVAQRFLNLDLIRGQRHAAGGIYAGFANAFGQRNWFASYSFNCDWSFYHQADKAVQTAYAGFVWEPDEFARKVAIAAEQLEQLRQAPRTIPPGHYRVYLAPAALDDVLHTLAWGGFGLKDHRTKQTTLLKMVEEGARLHPAVTLRENTRDGVAPNFQGAGFIKPDQVILIDAGTFRNCLVSPRSAKEYGVPTNAAASGETPQSLDMAAGDMPRQDVLQRLDTGVYINNVWYLNYSDRSACCMTGMTRFATFWVEHGVIQAPLNVMRFDASMYRMLGEHLLGLTSARELILNTSTYHQRSTRSSRVPGALVD